MINNNRLSCLIVSIIFSLLFVVYCEDVTSTTYGDVYTDGDNFFITQVAGSNAASNPTATVGSAGTVAPAVFRGGGRNAPGESGPLVRIAKAPAEFVVHRLLPAAAANANVNLSLRHGAAASAALGPQARLNTASTNSGANFVGRLVDPIINIFPGGQHEEPSASSSTSLNTLSVLKKVPIVDGDKTNVMQVVEPTDGIIEEIVTTTEPCPAGTTSVQIEPVTMDLTAADNMSDTPEPIEYEISTTTVDTPNETVKETKQRSQTRTLPPVTPPAPVEFGETTGNLASGELPHVYVFSPGVGAVDDNLLNIIARRAGGQVILHPLRENNLQYYEVVPIQSTQVSRTSYSSSPAATAVSGRNGIYGTSNELQVQAPYYTAYDTNPSVNRVVFVPSTQHGQHTFQIPLAYNSPHLSSSLASVPFEYLEAVRTLGDPSELKNWQYIASGPTQAVYEDLKKPLLRQIGEVKSK